MTDKEKLLKLFEEFGISEAVKHESDNSVFLEAKTHPKIDGYGFFCTVFEFDENDNFIKLGIWE